MTNFIKLFSSALVVVIIAIVVTALYKVNQPATSLSSVARGNEYHSTSTYSVAGAVNLDRMVVLSANPGALGSVIITGATANSIRLYDATSTKTNTLIGTTTVATIPASTAAGTYTYDLILKRGLVVEFGAATSLPTTTITWRE